MDLRRTAELALAIVFTTLPARAAESLPPPAPAPAGHPPIPLVAGVLTGWLGLYPLGALVGYAYAGDVDRGWEAVGWQMKGAGAGALVGLAAAPVLIWGSPSRGGIDGGSMSAIWLIAAPAAGAFLGHGVVGLGAGVDAYGVAARRGQPPAPALP